MELRSRSCVPGAASPVRPDARRDLDAVDAPARRTGSGVRTAGRELAGPLPRGPGAAEPADRSGRDAPARRLTEDAQWLDRASAQVLSFVAHRMLTEWIAATSNP